MEGGETQVFRTSPNGVSNIFGEHRGRGGSVVECLTRDRRAAGLSLTASLRCVIDQVTLILAYFWFNPGIPVPIYLKDC